MMNMEKGCRNVFNLLNLRFLDASLFDETIVWLNHILAPKSLERAGPVSHLSQQSVITLLNNQPNRQKLIHKWQPSFFGSQPLSKLQLHRFLKEFFSIIEFTYGIQRMPIEAGTTYVIRNHFSDIHAHRPPSTHRKHWCVFLTTAGHGEFNCLRQSILTKPGDLLLLSPKALYDYHRSDDCRLWSYQWAYFLADDYWQSLLQWPEAGPDIFYLSLAENSRKRLESIFETLLETLYSDAPLNQQLTKNILEQILIRLCQLNPNYGNSRFDARIQQAITYIQENYAQPFSIDNIADHAGLSASRFANLFKEQKGISPLAYRDEIRMTKACDLLFNTKLPMIKIAEQIGYNDPQYFSRSFKQRMKISPREYRKKA